jgi:Fic family protein
MNGLWQWEKWTHRQDIHRLIRMAIGHYQFETLHPFFDGNGRLGRLIAVLLLLHEQALSTPLLNISPYLEAHRDQYQILLRNISKNGDFDSWVEFFCDGVKTQSEAGIVKISQLIGLKDQIIGDLRTRRIRGLALQIAEDLIGYPIMSVVSAKNRYSVSYQAASNALNALHQAGHVGQIRLGNRHKAFVCTAVYDIVYPH